MTAEKSKTKVVGEVDQDTLKDMKRVALELDLNQSELITKMIEMSLPQLKKEIGLQ